MTVHAKFKGDGIRPSCSPCSRLHRRCHWPPHNGSSSRAAPSEPEPVRIDSSIRSLVSTPPSIHTSSQNFDFVSTDEPELALQNLDLFRLFRHYITHLATWYDLNDHCRHFTDLVPVKARQNPLLMSAILAFSAASKCQSNDGDQMAEKAEFYHLQTIRILLRVTSTIQDAISNGEVLAAICLLRSYEIISRERQPLNSVFLPHLPQLISAFR